MKIRSAVPENGCLIVLVDGKKTKKNKTKNKKKTSVKHIRYRLIGGCVKQNVLSRYTLMRFLKKHQCHFHEIWHRCLE